MGRPKIGTRVITYLNDETLKFVDELASDLGINTRSEMLRELIQHTQYTLNIKEMIMLQKGEMTDREFTEAG